MGGVEFSVFFSVFFSAHRRVSVQLKICSLNSPFCHRPQISKKFCGGHFWTHVDPPKILSDRNTRMGGENPLEKPPTETHGEPLEISRIIENYIVLLCILPISYVHQILFRDEKKL